MEAAAHQGSAALPHVNPEPANRPAWTVEELRKALRAIDSGLPSTVRTGLRYLASLGMTREEASERAYGEVVPASPTGASFDFRSVVELTASFACIWQDGPDGMDCREAILSEPDGWCPMCTAREAVERAGR